VITVSILINGQPIFTRSAVRIETGPDGSNVYRVDDCNTIRHNYDADTVALAHKMLDCIVEPRRVPAGGGG
jgi:hypothetical protein